MIPKEIKSVIEKLEKNNFEAYLVGGCVRDLLRKVKPNDWDITTNAKPDDIQKIFPESFLDNKFGTVRINIPNKEGYEENVEITPYRKESKYTDKRHPDKIVWAQSIQQDLARRDFTVNAMAMKINKNDKTTLVDPFSGQKDLSNKVIRAVGKAKDRFSEDALRMMRAVRFVITLGEGWSIEKETEKAIKSQSKLLKYISQERLREELMKIIMSPRAAQGIDILRKFGLLKYIIPELEEGVGVSQNKHHIYTVYEHNLKCLEYAAKRNFNKYVRIASLLHDIGKPRVKKGEGLNATFYNHEIVGANITRKILERLKFPKKDIKKIVTLVRYHLFYYNVGEVGESSVRRLIRKVGLENMDELIQVRMCDRIGSGCPKAEPYKLRHLRYVIDKVSQDPISVSKLKRNGNDIMRILNIKPGPKIGFIQTILLAKILDNPKLNTPSYLDKAIKELGQESDSKLKLKFEKAKNSINQIKMKRDTMTKKKYWVS